MRKENANLGDSGQVVGHHGQGRLYRPLRQLMVLLEGALAPTLSCVLEGKQRLPLRVIPALPQYVRVIPPARLGSCPHEGQVSLVQDRRRLFHGTGILGVDHLPRLGSIVGGDRIDLRLPGALSQL